MSDLYSVSDGLSQSDGPVPHVGLEMTPLSHFLTALITGPNATKCQIAEMEWVEQTALQCVRRDSSPQAS